MRIVVRVQVSVDSEEHRKIAGQLDCSAVFGSDTEIERKGHLWTETLILWIEVHAISANNLPE